MGPSTAWGFPGSQRRQDSHLAGAGVGKEPRGSALSTQVSSEFVSYAFLPDWRFHFHRETAWPRWRKEGSELDSDILIQPFNQPSALSPAPPGRVKWACPLRPVALSGMWPSQPPQAFSSSAISLLSWIPILLWSLLAISVVWGGSGGRCVF